MKQSFTIANIYDFILEPALKSLKQRMALMAKKNNVFPIIDLCCGTGKQVNYFSKFGKTAGLDIDETMVSFASHKYSEISFVLADATAVPLKNQTFNSVSISLALHDKSPEMRHNIIQEAKSLISQKGYLLLLDFENPWNFKSRIGYLLVYLVEFMAGWEHFQNGRQFLRAGGLEQFVNNNDLIVLDRYKSESSCSSIMVAQQK